MRRLYRRLARRWGRKTVILGMIGLAVLCIGGGAVYAKLGGTLQPQSSSDIELQRGLVGWYKLDDNAVDSAPYRHAGVVTGTSYVADRKGATTHAALFNGTSDYIRFPGDYSGIAEGSGFSGTYTLSVWALGGATNAGDDILMGRQGCNNGIVTNYPNSYRFALWNSGCTGIATIDCSVSNITTSWHLLTATYNNGAMQFYCDGQSAGTTTAASVYSGDTFSIGGGPTGFKFSGTLDDARIYNRVLSAAEARALYDQYDPGVQAASGEKGLAGWWKLDGNAKDSTPNRNNGTVNGATLTTDRKGRADSAYSFSGTGANNIALGNSTKFNVPEVTMTAWIKPTSTSGIETIMAKELQYKFRINSGGGIDVLASIDGSSWSYVQTLAPAGTIVAGNWYHLALTISSSSNTVNLYINGALAGSGSLGGSIAAYNANPLIIGAYDGVGTEPFVGVIDDARFYNRALSAGEIAAQYNSYDSQINLSANPTNSVSAGNINSGLVGYWNFNGNANDSTPYRNNGTVNGATLTTDRFGRASSAYSFDGASSYIEVPDKSIMDGTAGTWVAWIKVNSIPATAESIVLGKHDASVSCNGVSINLQPGGKIDLQIKSNCVEVDAVAPSALTTGVWHYVAATFTAAGTQALYMDGTPVATAGVPAGWSFGAGDPFRIGRSTDSYWSIFDGSIDEVRVYNRVLSSTEIQQLYNSNN